MKSKKRVITKLKEEIKEMDDEIISFVRERNKELEREKGKALFIPKYEIKEIEEEEEELIVMVIDANIGAGKSTILTLLQEDEEVSKFVEISHEQVSLWAPILPIFYSDPLRYGTCLQTTVMYGHTQATQNALRRAKEKGKKILVLERDPRSCEMFCRTMGLPDSDQKIISNMARMMTLEGNYIVPKVSTRILLDMPPEICLQRIRERSRDGEALISLDYLQALDREHKNQYDFYRGDTEEVKIFKMYGTETKEENFNLLKNFILSKCVPYKGNCTNGENNP